MAVPWPRRNSDLGRCPAAIGWARGCAGRAERGTAGAVPAACRAAARGPGVRSRRRLLARAGGRADAAAPRSRGPDVRRSTSRPAAPGHGAHAPSRLVPGQPDARLRGVHRPLREHAERCPRQARLSRRPRRHLPAPDAAAAAAAGRERRRLRGRRLPDGRARARDDGRPPRAGRRPARTRQLARARPRPQPRRARARVGGEGAGGRRALPRLLPHLPRPHHAGPLRSDAA